MFAPMTKKPATIRDRMVERIRRTRKTDVFLRADFADLGAYDVVGRELRRMVSDGLLLQVGYGLYPPRQTVSLVRETDSGHPSH